MNISYLFADTIILKNDKILQGKIISNIPAGLYPNNKTDKPDANSSNNSIGKKIIQPAFVSLQTSYGLIQVQSSQIKFINRDDSLLSELKVKSKSFWRPLNSELAFLLGPVFALGPKELSSHLSTFPNFYFQFMSSFAGLRHYHLYYAVQVGFQKFSFNENKTLENVSYSAIYNIPLLSSVYYLYPFVVNKYKFSGGLGLSLGYTLSMLSASTGIALGPNPILEIAPIINYLYTKKIKFAFSIVYQHIFDRLSSLYGLGFRFSFYYKL